jgi:2-polyprenyl-3-methyl-5-hydroxy-6-metoxy-1,4-benzoquinol methylase
MQELFDLGIVHFQNVVPYYPRVRDRDDIGVLRDDVSGVIFLDTTKHMNISHYDEMQGYSYWDGQTRAKTLELYAEDDERRAKQFLTILRGRDVIDVGCGTGGFMDRIRTHTRSIAGVEPQAYVRKELHELGYTMYRTSSDAPKESADVATLFHVLEHILEPLKTLGEVRSILRPGGQIIVEVPHARDVLLKLNDFKAFALWSEHLVLHTKESLRTYLVAAEFSDIKIEGYQRYPLANHVGWLVQGKPDGQTRFKEFGPAADAYARMLLESDQTDTLIATARKK